MRDVIELGMLLDYYGAFLTENQRELIRLSCEEDLSLSEIAEQKGISRQGVRDSIARGAKTLSDMESKLRLIERDELMLSRIGEIGDIIKHAAAQADEAAARELEKAIALLSDLQDLLEG